MKTVFTSFISGVIALALFIPMFGIDIVRLNMASPIKQENKEGTKDSELKTEITALRKEVAHLEADVLVLQTDIRGIKGRALATSANASNNVTSARPSPQLTPEEIRNPEIAKENERWKKEGEQLEADFQQQTKDPDWSTESKSLIQTALARIKIAEADILDIDCRATACRVEIANQNNQVPNMMLLALALGEHLPNIRLQPQEDGRISDSTVAYISK